MARVCFATCCAMRTMIGAEMNAMNLAALELDEAMGGIVGGLEVPELTNNAGFEAFEKQEPFLAPWSPHLIFAHKQNAPRRMVDQDTFKKLPNAGLVPSNDELGVVPFAGGTDGAGSAGILGGAGGSGD